jgi:hypothetical protein
MPAKSPSSSARKYSLGKSHGNFPNGFWAFLMTISRHPSSTLTAEAGVAVLRLKPDAFWPFSKVLFDRQIDFFDVNVVNETRNQTYERLADIAAEVGVNKSEILKLLTVPDQPQGDSYNVGNAVTNDIKKLVKVRVPELVPVDPT